MIGKTLGHYRVAEKIGSGGMGEVYRAHDEHLDRDVAVKVLTPGVIADEASRRRFRQEALALSKLSHPHIGTIFDFDTQDNLDFLAMEFLTGATLAERLEHGPLPEQEILELGAQIASALEEAHDHGVIHRDLKPANVMINPKGQAKVLDFGLAKTLRSSAQETATVTLSQTQQLIGTLPYMAPEQLRGESADTRTDIHALGAVFYEMATGHRPFEAKVPTALAGDILHMRPAPPRSRSPKLSEELERIIMKCLEKDPAGRYQSARELAADLRRLSAGTVSGEVPTTHAPKSVPVTSWLIPLAAILLIAAGLMFNVRGLRDRLMGGVGGRAPIRALAVLPLANLSGDPAQDYFPDGMTEALITEFARLGGVKIIARSSVLRYRGSNKSPGEIARELKVDALVTGAVVRSGNRVRITAQLLSAATEEQLWADRYDREFRDVLSLQGEIVSALAREIKLQLSPQEQARLKNKVTVSPEAYEAYLQGRFYRLKQTREDFDTAERYFQFALEKDPNYAMAYAGLASIWMMRGDVGFQSPSETFPKAEAFMNKALELDEGLADMRVSLGNQKGATQWDWSGAEAEYKRALEINPNLADAHFFYADLLLCLKRPEEWKREIQTALELDPLNDFNRSFYGWHLNYLRRYDEAIPIFQKLLPTGPNKSSNYLGLWGAYYKKGMFNEALSAAKSYFEVIGDADFANALGPGGGEAAYRIGMKHAGDVMAERSKQKHVPAIRIARMYAHSGDKDKALDWLEKAYQNRESPMARLAVFWDWDSLRGEPRFKDLLQRMKLPS